MTKPCSLPVVGSDVPLWEALKEALLPLSHEIVGTDPSHGDNEGACCRLRGGGWERKREKRKREMSRAVESLRISCLGGGSELLYVRIPRTRCGGAMTPRCPGTRLYLFPSESLLVPKGYSIVCPGCFAQLAVGCSNPAFDNHTEAKTH